MRRLAVVGVLFASCTLAAAQESPAQGEPAKSGNWFTRMFSWGSTPEPKKAEDKAKREPAAKGDSAAAVRAREGVQGGHVPIVALTAHAMKGDRERCLEAGMDAYVSKPVNAEELFATLARLVPEAGR